MQIGLAMTNVSLCADNNNNNGGGAANNSACPFSDQTVSGCFFRGLLALCCTLLALLQTMLPYFLLSFTPVYLQQMHLFYILCAFADNNNNNGGGAANNSACPLLDPSIIPTPLRCIGLESFWLSSSKFHSCVMIEDCMVLLEAG